VLLTVDTCVATVRYRSAHALFGVPQRMHCGEPQSFKGAKGRAAKKH